MRLLLDTHLVVWSLTGPDRIPKAVQVILLDPANDVVVSAASLFEIAMKRATGRRGAPAISAEDVRDLIPEAGFRLLDVTADHAVASETIAVAHPDPFDRLLLAQAQVEGLRLVTHDETLAAYDSRSILF